MPGEPCWGLLGRKDTAPGSPSGRVPGHLGSLHCLSSFIWKETDKHKAKPVIITLPIALSREFINLIALTDHLSGIPGESRDTGTLLNHPEQTSSLDYSPSKVASIIFICKTFSLSSHLKETQYNCCNFFHVNYKYLESLSRE